MVTISNREVPEFVRRKLEFRTRNKTVFSSHTRHGYAVFSYRIDWPIAFWDNETSQWFTHDDLYSSTTSRHTGLAKQGMGIYFALPSVTDLIAVETYGYTGAIARKLTQAPQPWNKPVDNVINTDLIRKTT